MNLYNSVLLCLASRIVPDIETFNSKEKNDFLNGIGQSLACRPQSMQKQFALFLAVIRWIPLFRYGKLFDHLQPAQQESFLKGLQDSFFPLLRKGFWGLKVLVYLGFYGNRERWPTFAYAPSFRGNSLLSSRMK